MNQLIPLNRPEELKAAGLPWDTEDKARWAYRKRHENGLAGAFVKIGKSIFVDPAKTHELARQQSAA
jgi:hypothetical protein